MKKVWSGVILAGSLLTASVATAGTYTINWSSNLAQKTLCSLDVVVSKPNGQTVDVKSSSKLAGGNTMSMQATADACRLITLKANCSVTTRTSDGRTQIASMQPLQQQTTCTSGTATITTTPTIVFKATP